MKKLILILLAAVLFGLAATSAVKACDSNWGNDQPNENDFE